VNLRVEINEAGTFLSKDNLTMILSPEETHYLRVRIGFPLPGEEERTLVEHYIQQGLAEESDRVREER